MCAGCATLRAPAACSSPSAWQSVALSYIMHSTQSEAFARQKHLFKTVAPPQVGKAARSTVISTTSAGSLRDRLVSLFGAKTVATLEPIKATDAEGFQLDGFVSSAVKNSSKSNGDRQYFFLNGRPVDLPKAVRVLNDVYKCAPSTIRPWRNHDIHVHACSC